MGARHWTMAVLVALGAATGCGPLVAIMATVTLDEQTRLERDVLGSRAEAPLRMDALAGLDLFDAETAAQPPQGARAEELSSRLELAETVFGRLQDVPAPDADLKAWQLVTYMNVSALRGRLGREQTPPPGYRPEDTAAWGLHTLAWQRAGHTQAAAELLLQAPLLTALDHEMESRRRRRSLYGVLVDSALQAGEDEQAFQYVLEGEAVELARLVPPGRLRPAGGPLHDLAAGLQRARDAAAGARDLACSVPADELDRGSPESRALADALDGVTEAGEALVDSPAGGLFVPAPADPEEVREALGEGTALLAFTPVGRVPGERYGAFLLTRDAFRAVRADGPSPQETQTARGGREAVEAILAALAEDLEGVQRLYLAPGPELAGLPWQALSLGGRSLGERFEVSFLGGISDLQWGFRNKRYGRQSVLVCGDARDPLASRMAGHDGAAFFDARTRARGELRQAAAFQDVLCFTIPLRVLPGSPQAGHLEFPGGLGALSGVSAAELTTYELRAGVACFTLQSQRQPWAETFGALWTFTRAAMAAGVPTVLYAAAPEDVTARYYETFLREIRSGPASRAHRQALAAVDPSYRTSFRLWGYAGMSDAEYAEYSRLEFSDLFRRASARLKGSRFAEAAADFLAVWRMVETLPLGEKKPLYLANVHAFLVQSWRGLRDYEAAARHQRMRIEHLAKTAPPTPDATLAGEYLSLGALLTQALRYEEAEAAYARAVELRRAAGDSRQLAEALGEQGKAFDRAARYDRALAVFGEAAQQYEALDDGVEVARQRQRSGAIYLKRLGDARRAEEEFRAALRLFGQADEQIETLETTIDVGLCRRRQGDFAGAMELFGQALERARAAGLDATVARALAESGNTHWLRGEYQKALALVGQSNALAEKGKADFQLNVNQQLLALIYWELNQYDRAFRALDAAVAAARRAERPLEVAGAHNNRGLILRRMARYEEALESFGRALAIDERLRSRWGQAYDHRNMGITLHRMGRLDQAAAHLNKAVALAREIGDRVNLARALLALGELERDQQRPADAEPLLEDALDQARALHMPEVEWRALRAMGQLHRVGGRREAALEQFSSAVDVVEQLRGAVKVEEFRSGLLANKGELYEDAVGLLLDMERPGGAFGYSERARARKFIDVLADQQFELKSDEERLLYQSLQELSRRLRALRETLAREADAERRRELAAQLDAAQARYAGLLVDIRVANPALSSFVTVEAVDAAELAGALPEGMAALVYYLMKDELAVWVLRGGRVEVRRVPVARDELAELVRKYRVMVQERELLSEVRRAARELHDILVRPVEPLLEGADTVCIVPHGALHYLSFASLHDGEAFLVERRSLFYTPSASVLARALRADPPPARKGDLKVLAVGNPAVGDPAWELPFSEQEVKSLARDFVNVTALAGETATEDWVKGHAGDFDVIHVAAHGRFDPVNPLFSNLLLTPGQDDGLLHLHEVTGLKLKATLVMLSACQSGLGSLEAADELTSLSRAFTYAGTRSILSTLWRVDDVSTALVAKHFYRRYVDHGAASSLRYAQLQVMNDGRHYHPTYWAGVVLSGDPR